jgi:cyclophilin family peptidyl-prolyl cis-trans isomerase
VADAAARPTVTQRAFLDLAYGDGAPAGRLVIDLFGEASPKTVANFVAFVTGENPAKKVYKGTPVHRVVKGFVLQGGDVIAGVR